MESIYLIISESDYLLKKSIKKIIDGKEADIIHYDLKEFELKRAIEDLDTYNFLSNKKIVILENPLFLTTSKSPIEQDVSLLEKYINNPNVDNTLIIASAIKLDERKNIVKLLKKNVKVVEDNFNINQMIKDNLDDYQMDSATQELLIEYTLGNYERCMNELSKLKLYKYDDKIILKSDVEQLVSRSIEDNVFELIDAIVNKDKKKAFEIYEEITEKAGEVNKVLILLANKFRLLYQVKILSKTYYKDEDIGKIIGSHPYPVKLARGMINKFSENDLLNYLRKLSIIDTDLKTGNTYQNIAFEVFMMSL